MGRKGAVGEAERIHKKGRKKGIRKTKPLTLTTESLLGTYTTGLHGELMGDGKEGGAKSS